MNVTLEYLPCNCTKNFNLVITLLTLFPLNFAVYLRKTPHSPLQTGVSFIARKNGSSSLHAMELRCIEKLINFTIAVSVVCCSRISRLGTVSSTYQKVFECQIWFPFVPGLISYNAFLHNKLIIARLLACHLKLLL